MSTALMTVHEVGHELGLSAEEVMGLVRSGQLPALRLLGRVRVERRMLDQLIASAYEWGEPEDSGQAGGTQADAVPVQAPGPQRPDGGAARVGPALALTEQQARVLRLVGLGQSNAEIAGTLSVEVSTVKSHVSRLLQRLDLRDRPQLVAYAWRSGLLRPPEVDPPSRGGSPAPGGRRGGRPDGAGPARWMHPLGG